MRARLLAAGVVLASATATAQPADRKLFIPPHEPQPTPEEQALLAEGDVSTAQIAGGGVAAIFVGFGVGQAIEGRWRERGWIFTLSESLAAAGTVGGAIGSAVVWDRNSLAAPFSVMVASALAFIGFRIWDISDAFTGPADHNARLRELHRRYDFGVARSMAPYVAPAQSGDGGLVAGLAFQF